MRTPFIAFSDELRDAVARGTVVTDTSLQAREIELAYNQHQRKHALTMWRAARVHTFNVWLNHCYVELARTGWKKARRELVDESMLLEIVELAAPDDEFVRHKSTVADAWRIFNEWALAPVRADLNQTENGRLCLQWFQNLETNLEENALITRAELPALLAEAASEGIWRPAGMLTFYGSGDRTRAQDELINRLSSLGAEVRSVVPSQGLTAQEHLLKFESEQQEWSNIAWWVREQLNRHGTDHRIGIVTSSLGNSYNRIKHRFEAVFPEVPDIERLVEINTPLTLLETPLVDDLLKFFTWMATELEYTEMRELSFSPFLRYLELPRTKYDRITEFQAFSKTRGNNVIRAIASIVGVNEQLELGEWLIRIRQVLTRLQWRDVTDELGDQAVAARIGFINLLNQLTRLSGIEGRCSWFRVVELLRDAARRFAVPRPPSDATVQVLSQSQSEGLEFDSIWVANMSDVEWPPAADPNPLIPINVLREAVVAKTTPAQMLRWARKLTADWQTSSKLTVFSHSPELDEKEHESSHLLRKIEDRSLNQVFKDQPLAKHEHIWCNATQDSVILTFNADGGRPLDITDDFKVRTSLLKNQAQCPFRAWSENRLELQPLEEPTAFFSAANRGTLVHEVLQKLIADAKSQEELAKKQRRDIRQIVTKTVNDYVKKHDVEVGKEYLKHEKTRILETVMAWQEAELEREPWTNARVEEGHVVTIAGFEFQTKVDRIEKMSSLGSTVIDYKTGQVSVRDWDPDRLVEPQMPLYATAVEDCNALMYAVIASDKTSYKGLATKKTKSLRSVNVPPDGFKARKQDWKEALEGLVEDFKNGRAVVDPYDTTKACRYCQLEDFCRVFDEEIQYQPPALDR